MWCGLKWGWVLIFSASFFLLEFRQVTDRPFCISSCCCFCFLQEEIAINTKAVAAARLIWHGHYYITCHHQKGSFCMYAYHTLEHTDICREIRNGIMAFISGMTFCQFHLVYHKPCGIIFPQHGSWNWSCHSMNNVLKNSWQLSTWMSILSINFVVFTTSSGQRLQWTDLIYLISFKEGIRRNGLKCAYKECCSWKLLIPLTKLLWINGKMNGTFMTTR